MPHKRSGFNLIELMVVVAVIAFFSMLTVPMVMKFLAKSKRTEAFVTLRSLYMAQKQYHAEHGKYAAALTGANSLGWKPEGTLQYTYGIGSGQNQHLVGALGAPASALKNAGTRGDGFTACAAGDIDGDGEYDVLCVDQDNKIAVITDDLV